MPKKFLIIRFSSIGDIIQCMSIVNGIKNKYPDAIIHWISRKDMSSFLAMDTRINKVWHFDKTKGFKGLITIAKELKKEKFDFIYDAHSNIRSNVLKSILVPRWKRLFGLGPKYTLRSKDRIKRVLLFKFGIDKFPMPFKGMLSFQKPLHKWGINNFSDDNRKWFFPKKLKEKIDTNIFDGLNINMHKFITIVPSAAWAMKRWPVSHWKELVKSMSDYQFLILAGPADTFCKEIVDVAPDRCFSLAGKTNLIESCYVVSKSNLVISADTGFLHAADMFKIKGISIIGPTAFGFATGKHIKTINLGMNCQPCTKDGSGKCSQKIYQQCLVDISSKMIANEAKLMLK